MKHYRFENDFDSIVKIMDCDHLVKCAMVFRVIITVQKKLFSK